MEIPKDVKTKTNLRPTKKKNKKVRKIEQPELEDGEDSLQEKPAKSPSPEKSQASKHMDSTERLTGLAKGGSRRGYLEADSTKLARVQDNRRREREEQEARRSQMEVDRVIREEEDGRRKKDEEERREAAETKWKLWEERWKKCGDRGDSFQCRDRGDSFQCGDRGDSFQADSDLFAEVEQDPILEKVTVGAEPLDRSKSANSEDNSIAKEHTPELISDRLNSMKSNSQSSTLSLPEFSSIDLANIYTELYDGPELTSNFVMNALHHDAYDEGVHARLQVLNVVIEENGYQLEINT
jgi:hypothetical protein